MHMLIGTFGDAAADNGEVFLLIRPRCVSVDKGGFARLKIAIANDAGFHVLRSHCDSPWSIGILKRTGVRRRDLEGAGSIARLDAPGTTRASALILPFAALELTRLQKDLLPHRCFVEQRPFAAQLDLTAN